MASNNQAFVKITNKEVWIKLNQIDEKLDNYIGKQRIIAKVAYSALAISLFIAGALITSAIGVK